MKPAPKPVGLTLTVRVVGVVNWPVGLTTSHCPFPELVLDDTEILTGVPLLVIETVCDSGLLVPS